MKKILILAGFIGILMFGTQACQQEAKQPAVQEQVEVKQAEATPAADPNDFTTTPLAGSVVCLDAKLDPKNAVNEDTAVKMAKMGSFYAVEANGKTYVVINKADNTSVAEKLAENINKKINLFGMAKEVDGINFFMLDKMEVAQ